MKRKYNKLSKGSRHDEIRSFVQEINEKEYLFKFMYVGMFVVTLFGVTRRGVEGRNGH